MVTCGSIMLALAAVLAKRGRALGFFSHFSHFLSVLYLIWMATSLPLRTKQRMLVKRRGGTG